MAGGGGERDRGGDPGERDPVRGDLCGERSCGYEGMGIWRLRLIMVMHNCFHRPEDVEVGMDISLKNLGLEYSECDWERDETLVVRVADDDSGFVLYLMHCGSLAVLLIGVLIRTSHTPTQLHQATAQRDSDERVSPSVLRGISTPRTRSLTEPSRLWTSHFPERSALLINREAS